MTHDPIKQSLPTGPRTGCIRKDAWEVVKTEKSYLILCFFCFCSSTAQRGPDQLVRAAELLEALRVAKINISIITT